ncbi:hypothetical protein [Fluviispira vulneris]|uniref:hypothetical protein n=1 Tax=Fluviispira vulneris TaxID=2763012 RepID=UPI001646FA10|nr:hypothetical protein [Fluviispira vulneris]
MIKIRYIYLGAFIEAFDFCVYLVFSHELSKFLLGKESLFLSILIFSISYIARPFGSLFFGMIAKNQKNGITTFLRNSPLWIAIPTFIIAFCPRNDFGIYLLLICRFMQGFIFGGESGLSFVFAYLNVTKYKNTAIAAFLTSGAVAMAACFILIPLIPSLFNLESWRLAFIISGILSLLFVIIRSRIPKTCNEVFDTNSKNVSIFKAISYIIIYAAMFNTVLAFLTSGQKYISLPIAMLSISFFSILFGFIFDNVNIFKFLKIINTIAIVFLMFFIYFNQDLLAFFTAFIMCCALGGISISSAIKYLANSTNLYPSFGLVYNVVMGVMGALVPIIREVFKS